MWRHEERGEVGVEALPTGVEEDDAVDASAADRLLALVGEGVDREEDGSVRVGELRCEYKREREV